MKSSPYPMSTIVLRDYLNVIRACSYLTEQLGCQTSTSNSNFVERVLLKDHPHRRYTLTSAYLISWAVDWSNVSYQVASTTYRITPLGNEDMLSEERCEELKTGLDSLIQSSLMPVDEMNPGDNASKSS
ncbi:MAG TPA: hypothetical protein VJJ21_02910 [Candidatus Nanoarchaeia archaeon]|nr:hypothetical protein [Candidatus Nanoarchaeia archaeon]